jgi:hypothetical protein
MNPVTQVVNSIDDDIIKLALILGLAAIVFCVWIIATAWKRVRQSEHRVRLTALLIERGIDPTQAETLLRAAMTLNLDDASAAQATPEARLVTHLTDNCYGGADVERVLSAARRGGEIDPGAVAIVKTMSENWVEAAEIARVLESRSSRSAQPHGRAVPA